MIAMFTISLSLIIIYLLNGTANSISLLSPTKKTYR